MGAAMIGAGAMVSTIVGACCCTTTGHLPHYLLNHDSRHLPDHFLHHRLGNRHHLL